MFKAKLALVAALSGALIAVALAPAEGSAAPRRCYAGTDWRVVSSQNRRASTVVGEVNNAYDDGTVGVASYRAGGGKVVFPKVAKREAVDAGTWFKYELRTERRTCLRGIQVQTRQVIRPVEWHGGSVSVAGRARLLDRCERSSAFVPGASLLRRRDYAEPRPDAAHVFGTAVPTPNGPDGVEGKTTTAFRFGSDPVHYLCGADASRSPLAPGPILSGAAPKGQQ